MKNKVTLDYTDYRRGAKLMQINEDFVKTLQRLGVVDEAYMFYLIDSYWPYESAGFGD